MGDSSFIYFVTRLRENGMNMVIIKTANTILLHSELIIRTSSLRKKNIANS
jgi:hypothetical protein